MKRVHLAWKDFFRKIGIYAHEGQKYEPEDSEQLSSYREDKSGQVLEEGINRSRSNVIMDSGSNSLYKS